MRSYLDASVLVAMLTNDLNSDAADSLLRRRSSPLVVSDFAAAEFSAAIARRVRTGEYSADIGRQQFVVFDGWITRKAERIEATAADVARAATFVRRFDLALRVPDALHVAIAARLDATLVTLDRQMVTAAITLGVKVAG